MTARHIALASIVGLVVALVTAFQTPAARADFAIGITVDRGEGGTYYDGDTIQVCVRVSVAGMPAQYRVRLRDTVGGVPTGTQDLGLVNGSRCVNSVIGPPLGYEVITAEMLHPQNGSVLAAASVGYRSTTRGGGGGSQPQRPPGDCVQSGNLRVCTTPTEVCTYPPDAILPTCVPRPPTSSPPAASPIPVPTPPPSTPRPASPPSPPPAARPGEPDGSIWGSCPGGVVYLSWDRYPGATDYHLQVSRWPERNADGSFVRASTVEGTPERNQWVGDRTHITFTETATNTTYYAVVRPNNRSTTYSSMAQVACSSDNPRRIDLSDLMPPVGDQGDQGSCVGWAVAYYYKSFREKKQNGWSYSDEHLFSPSYIFNQLATSNGGGIPIAAAFDLLTREGVAPLSMSPYDEHDWQTQPTDSAREAAANFKTGSTRQLSSGRSGLQEIKEHLAREQDPVVVSIPLYVHGLIIDDVEVEWEKLIGQRTPTVIDLPSASDLLPRLINGHAVTIVGYDDDTQRLKFINSWGTDWGEDGFGYITYEFFIESLTISFVMNNAP